MIPTITLKNIAVCMGISKQAVSVRATREKWEYTTQSVRGGTVRIYNPSALPKDVVHALCGQSINAARVVSPSVQSYANLSSHQQLETDARNGVVNAIREIQGKAGCSQKSAVQALLINARAGKLNPELDAMLKLARDPRGRKGDGYPSAVTLDRWLAAKDLTPQVPQKDMSIPLWADAFMACYQRPEKPSITTALERMGKTYQGKLPSYHQVYRWLQKVGAVTREKGRMGPNELKSIMPFVRRDFSDLLPNDVWSADGHTFDCEVQHPLHGRPFRPEITVFCDIATRRAVGWSVDLAESGMAVSDALRYSVEHNGLVAIIYVDNGTGYKNAYMQDEALGLIGRIGATVEHSLPYNSQARGVIERLHKTLWVQGAKELPGFIGREMDRQARLENFKVTRKAIKSGGTMPLLSWESFCGWVKDRIDWYNNRPHRTLGNLTPNQVLHKHMAKGWQPETLPADVLDTLFRPRVERVVLRGDGRQRYCHNPPSAPLQILMRFFFPENRRIALIACLQE